MSGITPRQLRITYFFVILVLVANLIYEATLSIGLFNILRHFLAHFFIVTSIYIVCRVRSFKLFSCHAPELMAVFVLLYGLKLFCFYIVGMDYSLLALTALALGTLLEVLPLLAARFISKPFRILYIALLIVFVLFNIFDAAYFFYTYSHIESVLFDNFNLSSIKGVITIPLALTILIVILLVSFMLIKLSRLSEKEGRDLSLQSLKSFSFLLIITLLLDISFTRLEAYFFQINPLDIHLERTKKLYRARIAEPVWYNFLTVSLSPIFDDGADSKLAEYQSYTKQELAYLHNKQMINQPLSEERVSGGKVYSRIILVVLESLPIDYIHFYHDKVPASITPNLDRMLKTYPHIDNFYSANMPTNKGLNAIINSHLEYTPSFSMKHPQQSLFSVLQQNGYEGYFLRGVSKFYSNEIEVLPKVFKMQHFITKEDLDEKYLGSTGWGYSNDVLYQEAIAILKQQKQAHEKTFLLVKTIDLHQPGPHSGFQAKDLPADVAKTGQLFQALYWADYQLGLLEKNLIEENLFDDETLVIITSDHNPNPGGDFQKMAMSNAYQRVSRIPLIFMTKDQQFKGIRRDSYASQVDIAPTLLNLLGIEVPEHFMGRDLLQTDYHYAVSKYADNVYLHSEQGTDVITLESAGVAGQALTKWLNNYKTDKYILSDAHASSNFSKLR